MESVVSMNEAVQIKWKTKNTKLSEQFQNPMEKSQKEVKSIPLTSHCYNLLYMIL